jgi:hypothetical protein
MLKKRLLATLIALAVLAVGWTAGIEMANAQSSRELIDKYTPLAGSKANATTLVDGLRSGSDFTLSGTKFDPPTGKLGNGEVNIALSLTQAELTKQGVTQPTTQQLETALNDILKQRADGKGWGQIANSLGFKLGDVMRSEKAGEHARDTKQRIARQDRVEKPGKLEKPEHAQKFDRPEKPERPERPERPGR